MAFFDCKPFAEPVPSAPPGAGTAVSASASQHEQHLHTLHSAQGWRCQARVTHERAGQPLVQARETGNRSFMFYKHSLEYPHFKFLLPYQLTCIPSLPLLTYSLYIISPFLTSPHNSHQKRETSVHHRWLIYSYENTIPCEMQNTKVVIIFKYFQVETVLATMYTLVQLQTGMNQTLQRFKEDTNRQMAHFTQLVSSLYFYFPEILQKHIYCHIFHESYRNQTYL